MLAEIQFGYSIDRQVTALDDAAYERLREGVPLLDLPLDRTAKWDFYKVIHNPTLVDLTREGALLTANGIDYTIKRFKACRKVAIDKAVNIQVAIPNLLLFAVDEVTWLEDACTEDLQKHLDDGWRILAVCPAENSRRPTYIIGRTKKPETF